MKEFKVVDGQGNELAEIIKCRSEHVVRLSQYLAEAVEKYKAEVGRINQAETTLACSSLLIGYAIPSYVKPDRLEPVQ